MIPRDRFGAVLLFLSGGLFILACTALFTAPVLLVWKLSILATEFGHWLALACLILLVFVCGRGNGSGLSFGLLLTAGLVFLNPLRQALTESPQWKSDIIDTFGPSPVATAPMISFKRLWIGDPEKNILPERHVYAKRGGLELTFDIYRAPGAAPAPWVMVVHGGGWNNGDLRQLSGMNVALANRGYAVAAISYRLAPASLWPAQRDDVLAAAAYIKEHHRELGVDPERWAILGRSAGGQLAEAAAYALHDPALKGCVALYAPADLNFAYRFSKDKDLLNSRRLLANLLGGTPAQAQAAYDDASAINSVRADSPPTLLLHGKMDPLTWYIQSRRLHDRIQKIGGKSLFIALPWATHGFDYTLKGPGGQVAMYAINYFLERVFNGTETNAARPSPAFVSRIKS